MNRTHKKTKQIREQQTDLGLVSAADTGPASVIYMFARVGP